MYHSLLEERQIELREKKTIVAALYEAKIDGKEIIRLLKKYCNINEEEGLNIFKNEKFINAPCRELEQYLLLEKGYDYKTSDLFINKHAVRVLVNNPELSKLTAAKLYAVAKEHEEK
ncbi:hypothetical protein DIC82_18065 [Clostridium beijerinckii]|nr:hypothetical protein DIC82_18065 [Clostridium beijerinckii]